MLTGDFPFLNISNILNDDLPDLKKFVISEEAKEFIAHSLVKNRNERLGSRKNPKNVKEYSFLSEINWDKLENGEIDEIWSESWSEQPFKPTVVIYFKKNKFL